MNPTVPVLDSFVVFALDDRSFALPSAEVVELSRAEQLQKFPHTSPDLEGVFIHRGSVLPVWNLARRLAAPAGAKKFFLLSRRNFAAEERTAIPVSTEGLMLRCEMQPPPAGAPAHVRGVLVGVQAPDGRQVEVLDLERLATERARP